MLVRCFYGVWDKVTDTVIAPAERPPEYSKDDQCQHGITAVHMIRQQLETTGFARIKRKTKQCNETPMEEPDRYIPDMNFFAYIFV